MQRRDFVRQRRRRRPVRPRRRAPCAFAAASIKPDAKSALLVIDVQNCFVTGGTLPVKGGEEVVPIINKLAAAFENVVVTQDWHTAGHVSFASAHAGKKPFETTKLGYGTQVLWPDHCVQGIAGRGAVQGPVAAEGAAHHPQGLPPGHRQLLGLHGSRRQDLDRPGRVPEGARRRHASTSAAWPTDFCVAWTALDARKAGFKASVIEDASRGIDLNGSLKAAWDKMAKAGVKRIQSSDIAV